MDTREIFILIMGILLGTLIQDLWHFIIEVRVKYLVIRRESRMDRRVSSMGKFRRRVDDAIKASFKVAEEKKRKKH